MNWGQLHTIIWLRWRLTRNQWSRGGPLNAIITLIVMTGALIIGTLNNSLNLLQVEHFWQKVVLGGVILAASLVDAGLRRLDLRR